MFIRLIKNKMLFYFFISASKAHREELEAILQIFEVNNIFFVCCVYFKRYFY